MVLGNTIVVCLAANQPNVWLFVCQTSRLEVSKPIANIKQQTNPMFGYLVAKQAGWRSGSTHCLHLQAQPTIMWSKPKQSVSEWLIVSDFGDSYCIYRACELVNNQAESDLNKPGRQVFVMLVQHNIVSISQVQSTYMIYDIWYCVPNTQQKIAGWRSSPKYHLTL